MSKADYTTDEIRIAREYLELMEFHPSDSQVETIAIFVRAARRDEPRIRTGAHMHDWENICDDDDTFDTFYGADYFAKG